LDDLAMVRSEAGFRHRLHSIGILSVRAHTRADGNAVLLQETIETEDQLNRRYEPTDYQHELLFFPSILLLLLIHIWGFSY
jgi:hypothetical protein